MSNQCQNDEKKYKYDLEERTAKFGERVIIFSSKLTKNPLTMPIISQLIRSTTSIGANYCEANECNSKKDFQHKISIAKKEAKETMYWLEMAAELDKNLKEPARKLWQEAHELVLIFSSILKK